MSNVKLIFNGKKRTSSMNRRYSQLRFIFHRKTGTHYRHESYGKKKNERQSKYVNDAKNYT